MQKKIISFSLLQANESLFFMMEQMKILGPCGNKLNEFSAKCCSVAMKLFTTSLKK